MGTSPSINYVLPVSVLTTLAQYFCFQIKANTVTVEKPHFMTGNNKKLAKWVASIHLFIPPLSVNYPGHTVSRLN